MTEVQALKVFGVLAAGFRNVLYTMTPDEAKVMAATYAEGIIDLDFMETDAAVRRMLRSAKKLPLIADIRDAVLTVTRGQVRTGVEAWGDLKRMHSKFSRYRHPSASDFTDPIVARVVLEGLGWIELCDSENQTSDRARFIEAYDQLARQGRTEAQVSHRAAGPALPSRGRSPELPAPSAETVLDDRTRATRPVLGDAAPFAKPSTAKKKG